MDSETYIVIGLGLMAFQWHATIGNRNSKDWFLFRCKKRVSFAGGGQEGVPA